MYNDFQKKLAKHFIYFVLSFIETGQIDVRDYVRGTTLHESGNIGLTRINIVSKALKAYRAVYHNGFSLDEGEEYYITLGCVNSTFNEMLENGEIIKLPNSELYNLARPSGMALKGR